MLSLHKKTRHISKIMRTKFMKLVLKFRKLVFLIIYYVFASKLPNYSFPGGKFYNWLRVFCLKRIISLGNGCRIMRNVYVGSGRNVVIGNNCRINEYVRLDNVLIGNHVNSISILNQLILGLSLLINIISKHCYTLYFSVYFVCFGIIAIANHYYCHARTNLYDIPLIFSKCQDIGILISNKHHKIHHQKPHNCNWNFLIGFSKIYEKLYKYTNYLKK